MQNDFQVTCMTNMRQILPKKETMCLSDDAREKETAKENFMMTISARHAREAQQKKLEADKARRLRIMKKKRLEIWYEQRRIQQENYTQFLETGRRYAAPCPAVELLRAMQSAGGFPGI